MAKADSIDQNFWEDAKLGKHCTKCNQIKPFNEFSLSFLKSLGRSVRASQCKMCQAKRNRIRYHKFREELSKRGAIYQKHWANKFPERHRKNRQRQHLKKTYGLTMQEYQKMHIEQNGLCAICHKAETSMEKRTGIVRMLAVDHDHKTNRNRGLLCKACNVGLGHFLHDVQILRKAIAYLQLHDLPR